MTEESVITTIAKQILVLDDNVNGDRDWIAHLDNEGVWNIFLGATQKMGGLKRDKLFGCTDQSNVELITFYRNNVPVLAEAYLDLKKRYDELAKVSGSKDR